VTGIPEVGAPAPDFTLKDQDRQDVALSALRGERAALVVFYPFAFSAVCTGELTAVRDDLATFQNERVQVLAVSCDHPFALRAWADAQGFGFPLLSDFWPHGGVAQRYGVFNAAAGFALRGTFLVDRAGVVRFREVNQPGEARDQDGWRRAVAALAAVDHQSVQQSVQ
jgi:mycoredoxin-dependent peroxiredoxin